LLLERDGIRVRLHTASETPAELSMKLTGVDRLPPVRGEQRLPGATNYFPGGDPARWRACRTTPERGIESNEAVGTFSVQ